MKALRPVIGCVWLLMTIGPLSAQDIVNAQLADAEIIAHLQHIMRQADIASLRITRGSSTPAEQARIMFDAYLRPGASNCRPDRRVHGHRCQCASFAQRRDCALATYGEIGDAAINAVDNPVERAAAINAMTAALIDGIERVDPRRTQIAHVVIAGKRAIDVAPSSIPSSRHAAFIAAVSQHPAVIVERFFYPGKPNGPAENAFHIEFRVAH